MRRPVVVLGLVAALGAGCKREEPQVQVVEALAPVPAAPKAAPRASGAARRGEALRELTKSERALFGTWVAMVDGRATHTTMMAGKVVFGLPAGKDLVSGVMEAIETDKRVATDCVWLELYEDLSGFRNECAVVAGEASALEKTDPFSGAKSPLGVGFRWEMEKEKVVKITFDEDLLVPGPGDAGAELKFRQWHLRFSGKAREKLKVEERFPEHGYLLPVQYEWEIFPGRFLGSQAK